MELATENKKWIQETVQETEQEIAFSTNNYGLLCAPGNKYVDARIHFSSSDDRPVLVVLEMKESSSDKYLNITELEEIKEVIPLLKKHYPKHKVILWSYYQ